MQPGKEGQPHKTEKALLVLKKTKKTFLLIDLFYVENSVKYAAGIAQLHQLPKSTTQHSKVSAKLLLYRKSYYVKGRFLRLLESSL